MSEKRWTRINLALTYENFKFINVKAQEAEDTFSNIVNKAIDFYRERQEPVKTAEG